MCVNQISYTVTTFKLVLLNIVGYCNRVGKDPSQTSCLNISRYYWLWLLKQEMANFVACTQSVIGVASFYRGPQSCPSRTINCRYIFFQLLGGVQRQDVSLVRLPLLMPSKYINAAFHAESAFFGDKYIYRCSIRSGVGKQVVESAKLEGVEAELHVGVGNPMTHTSPSLYEAPKCTEMYP